MPSDFPCTEPRAGQVVFAPVGGDNAESVQMNRQMIVQHILNILLMFQLHNTMEVDTLWSVTLSMKQY